MPLAASPPSDLRADGTFRLRAGIHPAWPRRRIRRLP